MFRPVLAASLGLLGASLLPAPAYACGGFFCNRDPIDQSKERIVFGVDDTTRSVEVHVQIFYQGDASRFAWVVPVPAVPDIALGTDALFDQLEWQTRPYFNLRWEERGTCDYDGGWGLFPAFDESANADGAGGAGGGGGGVEVIKEGQTGPFDWKVVEAESQSALLAWLADPDGNPGTDDAYDIPDAVGEVLGGYLSRDAKFVAFKLVKDADAGDITPIVMRYDGDRAVIPLVLTSIAATPDMRLQPYIFTSGARAVPQNYLHVGINEAKVNWLTGGANYDDIVTQAANEAGGQAFATDYYGPTDTFRDVLYREGRFDTDDLRTFTDPARFVDQLLFQGFPRNAQMQNLLRTYIPMPQSAIDAGIEESWFYNCLDCYSEHLDDIDFDPEAFVDAIEELVITPMAEAERLFHDYSHVTRLVSSVSPEEMTLDPVFVRNPDMTGTVTNQRQATLVIDCGDNGKYSESPRWIELTDGRVIEVPPDAWFRETGSTYEDWLDGVDQPAAAFIEQTGASGQPVPVADNSGAIDDALDAWNAYVLDLTGRGADGEPQVTGGCACNSSRTGASWSWALALLGLAGLRRRRAT